MAQASSSDGAFPGMLPGWGPIVFQLDREIRELLPDYEILQVKEKFGRLRFYWRVAKEADTSKVDQAFRLVEKAERTCAETCEVCGARSEGPAPNQERLAQDVVRKASRNQRRDKRPGVEDGKRRNGRKLMVIKDKNYNPVKVGDKVVDRNGNEIGVIDALLPLITDNDDEGAITTDGPYVVVWYHDGEATEKWPADWLGTGPEDEGVVEDFVCHSVAVAT